MSDRKAVCEIGPDGQAIRIFRNRKMAVIYAVNPSRGLSPEPVIKVRHYAEAVGQIRRQVFARDDFTCVHCGQGVVWDRGRWNSGELDERKARGLCEVGSDGHYHSGEISVANSQTLCRLCHTGAGGKHDRSPSFCKTGVPSEKV